MSLLASPADGLVYLCYVSSAVRLFSDLELIELLRKARLYNQHRAITGMLLYKEGNVLQILEGPHGAVKELFGNIERDPRHKDVTCLCTEPIGQREFSDWSMAFRDLSKLAEEEEGYSSFLRQGLGADHFRTRPGLAYKLISRFKRGMG